jgi:molybdopterin/thiamine biosynthesis adenylyltransferase/predicted GNAT family N-acyltransferase
MSIVDAPWHVSAVMVTPGANDAAELVREIRELRARILFDYGRRPAFSAAGRAEVDAQDLDYGAWHFIGRSKKGGPPLGYVRLCTPVTGDQFQSRAYLGAESYAELLRTDGLRAEDVFEHSRLVVEYRARKLGLGEYLNAMAIAAAHSLGATAMIGTAGTADGQDKFHGRFGFRPVPGTRRYVEQYAEDVVVMLHRVADGAGEHSDLVARLRDAFPALAAARSVPSQLSPAPRSSSPAPVELLHVGPGSRRQWRPQLYEPTLDIDRTALTVLLDSGRVREVCDTIDAQLEELVRSREPSRSFDAGELRAAKDQQLAGISAWEYGTWAWYPWSGRLVHLLPREEFRLVRTDRNRGKIDRPAQRRLLGRRIGIIGLSVGNSAALTLALEGIGAAFKLADFDQLSLSNLNRLRAGVHHLGLGKSVIAARQMFEIDPYLDIEIFPGGLTDDTMDEFFIGGNGPIDLLVEECDTPYVKIAARERARELGIPVVMDANDRGLLDVERFDHEPDRPLLHGLLGDIHSKELRELSFEEKVALILAMVDAGRISPELAASIPEIGRTLSSWPQLASGVALGGALTAEASRRILLGQLCDSGRYYTDFEVLLAPERSTA